MNAFVVRLRDTVPAYAPLAIGAGVLGAGMLFTLTVTIQNTPLRLASTDLILPALLALAGWTCIHERRLPPLRLKSGWLWLGGMTLWLLSGILIGHNSTGDWQTWAVLNKGLGWFVLLAYFLTAVWLRQNAPSTARAFLAAFVGAASASAAIGYCNYVLEVYQIGSLFSLGTIWRVQGFMENPNAFGIAVACALAIVAVRPRSGTLFGPRLDLMCGAILAAALFLTASRSAWLGLAVALGFAALFGLLQWRRIFLSAGLAVIVLLATFHLPGQIRYVAAQVTNNNAVVLSNNKSRTGRAARYIARNHSPGDTGVEHRIENIRLGLQQWETQPLIGIGIGSQLVASEQNFGRPQTLHTSAAWILIELGLIGLFLFAGFFLAALIATTGTTRSGFRAFRQSPELKACVLSLLVLGGASIGTEVLYQRYLWFILGLALATPNFAPQNNQTKNS